MKKTLAVFCIAGLITQMAFASSGQGTNEEATQAADQIQLDLVDEGDSNAQQSSNVQMEADDTAQVQTQSAMAGAYGWVVDLVGKVVGESWKKPVTLTLAVVTAGLTAYSKLYGNPLAGKTAAQKA